MLEWEWESVSAGLSEGVSEWLSEGEGVTE